MEKPATAPGCFAAASVFSHDSEVCRGCVAFRECASASFETLAQIRNVIDVSDLLKRHDKAKKASRKVISEIDEANAAALPPGNKMLLLTGTVERKTEVVKVTFDVSEDDESVIATLPVKARPVAVMFCKTGMLGRVKKCLQEGRNALVETGPGWLRVAIDLLLSGGFVRSELREAMRRELSWEDSSAGPHTSMAVALLVGFGIANEMEGRLVLARPSI